MGNKRVMRPTLRQWQDGFLSKRCGACGMIASLWRIECEKMSQYAPLTCVSMRRVCGRKIKLTSASVQKAARNSAAVDARLSPARIMLNCLRRITSPAVTTMFADRKASFKQPPRHVLDPTLSQECRRNKVCRRTRRTTLGLIHANSLL